MDLQVPWSMYGELEMPIGELRGDQVDEYVECAGQLRVRAGDEAQTFDYPNPRSHQEMRSGRILVGVEGGGQATPVVDAESSRR